MQQQTLIKWCLSLKNSLFVIFILLGLTLSAQISSLSSNAKISLLTCGPGNDLYSIFGHTAIRVNDPKQNIDAVFNYGTFEFTDDFYFQFTMGKLNYRLSIEPYQRFVANYQYENRWVIEQTLNIDSTQKQQIFEFLLNNSKPENSHYLYDFFYDNCSTRPRDVFENVLGKNLNFNFLNLEKEKTFRNMIDLYLRQMPWSDIGIDLALGTPCDKTASPYLKTFLPDYLMDEIGRATLTTPKGNKPLVHTIKTIIDARPAVQFGFNWIHPLVFFIGFILLHNIILYTKKTKLITSIDILLYTIIGIAGWLVFFLWFITDHNATRPNYNILWAMPLYIPFGILFIVSPKTKLFRLAMHCLNFCLLTLISCWAFLPQNLNEFYLPLIIWLFYRNSDRLGWLSCLNQFFQNKKRMHPKSDH